MISSDALPGMEDLVPVSDNTDMSDAKRYTAEVVYRDHPERFRRICFDLFRAGESASMIAAKEHVSRNTVRAIRDMVMSGVKSGSDAAAAAFFVAAQARAHRHLVELQALERLSERVVDGDEDLTVDQLVTIVRATASNHDGQSAAKSSPTYVDQVVDVDQYSSAIEGLAGNGLPGKKNCGREDGGEDVISGASDDGIRGETDTVSGGQSQSI